MSELLTIEEKELIRDLGELGGKIAAVVGDGPTRQADMNEMIGHVHALQQAVMAQAAARAYPRQFRRLGTRHPLDWESYTDGGSPPSCSGCGALDFDRCPLDCPGVAEVTG